MRKKKVAVLLPARNEGKVIGSTIKSLLKVVKATDIYVVSDGSTDQTVKKAHFWQTQVLPLVKNRGKANALNLALQRFQLADRYQSLMFLDADSMVSPSYLKEILKVFAQDDRKKIACVVGKVKSQKQGWLSAYRTWEYEVSQSIHKKAQSLVDAVLVCPGCATVCRSEIFKKISIPTGTLTEDMDLTFLIHRQNLGRIVFTEKAKVTTQDPRSLRDFLKQIDRWYTGFWQCVLKHHLPWGGQKLDLEVAILATEGLFNGLLVLGLLFFLPTAIFQKASALFLVFIFDLLLLMLPTLILAGLRQRNLKLLSYLPLFYFLRFLSSLVFLRSFLRVVFSFDLGMKWNQTKRYSFAKENLWPNQFPRPTVSP